MKHLNKNVPTKTEPKFGIISPIGFLDEFSSQSPFHLTLAHLVDTSESYAEFYRYRSRTHNDFIIMDNGAFELGESYNPDKLIELGDQCGADVLVLPDYPFQPAERTIKAAEDYIPVFQDAGYDCMYVPQSKTGDIEEWIEAYEWGANNDDVDIIGCSILAMPNALNHLPASYSRVVLTAILIDRGIFNFDKYHHYLGIQNISLEIPALRAMGVMNSCDSSNPVWCGLNGIEYSRISDSYVRPSKQYIPPVNFENNLAVSDEIIDIVQRNLDLALELFNK